MAKWVLILVALSLNCAEQDFDYENDQDIYNEYNYYDEGEVITMALRPDTESEYVGRIVPADGNYPYGSGRDESTSGADDGTPKLAIGRNDVYGLCQGLLLKAGIVPDGVIDIANGQYREALDTMPISLTQLSSGDTVIVGGPHKLTFNDILFSYENTSTGEAVVLSESSIANHSADGATYSLIQSLKNGGVSFEGTTPGTAVTTRRNSFALDVGEYSYTSPSVSFYIGAGSLALTGIPNTAAIMNLTVDMQNASGRREVVSVSAQSIATDAATTTQLLKNITGYGTTYGLFTPTIATLYVDYDPSLVD